MLATVKHLSISQFNDYIPGKDSKHEIAISIGWNKDESLPRLHKDWDSLIRLSFCDLDEVKLNIPEDALPDLHARYEHGEKILYADKYPLCDYNDALRVVSVLDKYHKMDVEFHVVVHCNAGVSRSGATANFIAMEYGAKEDSFEPLEVINTRWFRLLSKAKLGLEPIIFNANVSARDFYAGKVHP